MIDYALLDALAAVVRHGSFDRAASELSVTASRPAAKRHRASV
jgi:LysR family transcriptional regulator (chromosome initiation inhibitor)